MNRSIEIHPRKMFSAGRFGVRFDARRCTTIIDSSSQYYHCFRRPGEHPHSQPTVMTRRTVIHDRMEAPLCPFSVLAAYCDGEDVTPKPSTSKKYYCEESHNWNSGAFDDLAISRKDFPWDVDIADYEYEQQPPRHTLEIEESPGSLPCPVTSIRPPRFAGNRENSIPHYNNDYHNTNKTSSGDGFIAVEKTMLHKGIQSFPNSDVPRRHWVSKDRDHGIGSPRSRRGLGGEGRAEKQTYSDGRPLSALKRCFEPEDPLNKPPCTRVTRHRRSDGCVAESIEERKRKSDFVAGASRPPSNIAREFDTSVSRPDVASSRSDTRRRHQNPSNQDIDGYRQSMTKQRRDSVGAGAMKKLPAAFEPLPYSVVVGKCKESLEHNIGNQRLRILASNYLPKYAAESSSKKVKSEIVSVLIKTIHSACPMGGFVRLGKDGRWYTISDHVAREKVGYTFRELLGDSYRSSSKAKVVMRSINRKNREGNKK